MASRERVEVCRWEAILSAVRWVRELARDRAQHAWERGHVLTYVWARGVEGACDAALELATERAAVADITAARAGGGGHV